MCPPPITLVTLCLVPILLSPPVHSFIQLYDTNPDIFRNSAQLIESRGFRSEVHTVTTRDGYILTIFRLVNPYQVRGRRRPLILWHGVGVTSDSWLISTAGGLNQSGVYVENNLVANDCRVQVTDTLGYTLAACGYDVWLANSRGSVYGNRHVRYSNQEARFWQYTLTEMAMYDVPDTITYILRQTGEASLAYVGHSLGTDIMFAAQSLMPELGTLVKPFVALAPVAFIGNIWSSARLGVPLEPLLRLFPGPLGVAPELMQLLGVFICGNELLVQLCADVLYTINGFDQRNFNKTIVAVNVGHSAATTSTWLYAHLAQLVASGQYRMFDYGSTTANQAHYNSATPPNYPLTNITSPNIAIFRGYNDPLADARDVDRLVHTLSVDLLDNYLVPYEKWNHQDFQLGVTQGFYVNRRLLDILRRFD